MILDEYQTKAIEEILAGTRNGDGFIIIEYDGLVTFELVGYNHEFSFGQIEKVGRVKTAFTLKPGEGAYELAQVLLGNPGFNRVKVMSRKMKTALNVLERTSRESGKYEHGHFTALQLLDGFVSVGFSTYDDVAKMSGLLSKLNLSKKEWSYLVDIVAEPGEEDHAAGALEDLDPYFSKFNFEKNLMEQTK